MNKSFPENVNKLLNEISTSCQSILKANLVGIYIHGSLAFNCFTWEKSDIDFLVITNDIPAQKEKEMIIQKLIDLEPIAPTKGFEMSLVLLKYCKNFVYPTPFELHYSITHRETAKNDLESYCKKMNGIDKDLAAHFTVVKSVGKTLFGPEIKDVFICEIPKEDYIDSVKNDIVNSKEDIKESIKKNDNSSFVYIVLNLCRVLALVTQDLVLSKEQGGIWGINNLPLELHPVINAALESYKSLLCKWADFTLIEKFVNFMIDKIYK